MTEIFDKSKEVWNANTDHLAYPDENLARLMSGKYVDIPMSGALLDHGFGTGNNFQLYRNYFVCGCEISKTFIERAEIQFPKVALEQVEGLKLVYPDDYFDIVVSWNVIHYNGTFEDTRTGVNELHRILKPGGVLLLSTMSKDHSFIQRSEYLGYGSYKITEDNGFDNRVGLTLYCAPNHHTFSLLFSKFAKVQYGSAHSDLFNPMNSNAWNIVYAVKGND